MTTSASLNRIERPAPAHAHLRGEVSPNRQPQWLTDVVVLVIHAERSRPKQIAAALNVTPAAVYKAADRSDPHALKAFWIPDICRETGSFAILDALEARVGRVAFVLPPVNPRIEEMNRELARTVSEFGEFLTANGTALADGRLEPHEVKPLLGAIDAMLAGLSEYRAMVLEKAREDAA